MTTSTSVIVAIVFFWTGLVVAISFLEAPLKFQAPDVTVKIGLGIGRLVFRALNAIEVVLAAVIVGAVLTDRPTSNELTALAIVIVALALQLTLVRPRLSRRSDLVLAGHVVPHSRAHYAYVALEVLKLIALIIAGIMLLAD